MQVMQIFLAQMISHIFEAVSVIGIISALLIATRQNSLTSRAIRAQSFVNLLNLEIESGFQEGMIAITSLQSYRTYADFELGETEKVRLEIYDTVVFLNYMAVLGEEGYLHIQDAWDVYFWSYRKCQEKLLPWWLAAQRVNQPNVFPSFERACAVTSLVSLNQIAAFDKKIGMKHLKKYQKTSAVSKRKLRSALATQIQPNMDHPDAHLS